MGAVPRRVSIQALIRERLPRHSEKSFIKSAQVVRGAGLNAGRNAPRATPISVQLARITHGLRWRRCRILSAGPSGSRYDISCCLLDEGCLALASHAGTRADGRCLALTRRQPATARQSVTMPRPQFSIRTLLWLTLVAAAFLAGMQAEWEILRRHGVYHVVGNEWEPMQRILVPLDYRSPEE